jgi:hypothetical protein
MSPKETEATMEQGSLTLADKPKAVCKERELLKEAHKRIVQLLLDKPDLTKHDKIRILSKDEMLKRLEIACFEPTPDMGWTLHRGKWSRNIGCFELSMKRKEDRFQWAIIHTPTEITATRYVHDEEYGKKDMEKFLGVWDG